jgi:membrane dipeptidase
MRNLKKQLLNHNEMIADEKSGILKDLQKPVSEISETLIPSYSQISRRKFMDIGIMSFMASLPLLSSASNLIYPGFRMHPDPQKLLKNLFLMDGHTHVMSRQLLQGLEFGERYPDGTVDLPRIIEGKLNALFFSVYTPEPYYPGRHEVKNTFRVVQLALEQLEKNSQFIELALNASDIKRINKKGKIAAFLDLEGGFDLDGDLNLLKALYRLGLRSLQLTAHNESNGFIDSCYGPKKWGGMNEHGHTIVQEMNRLGMLINVAHASDEAIIQAAEASYHPIAYTHGGFRGIVNNIRCISDEGARAIAKKGGVVGIQFGNTFNNPKYVEWLKLNSSAPKGTPPRSDNFSGTLSLDEIDSKEAKSLPFVFKGVMPDEIRMGVDQLAKVIDYGVQLIGEDHVALGSDLDGGVPLPKEMKDISDYPAIVKALANLGYSDTRIRKICGLNWLRLIQKVTEGS